jgi:hypothetical protein
MAYRQDDQLLFTSPILLFGAAPIADHCYLVLTAVKTGRLWRQMGGLVRLCHVGFVHKQ